MATTDEAWAARRRADIAKHAANPLFVTASIADWNDPARRRELQELAEQTGRVVTTGAVNRQLTAAMAHLRTLPTIPRDNRSFCDNIDALAAGRVRLADR